MNKKKKRKKSDANLFHEVSKGIVPARTVLSGARRCVCEPQNPPQSAMRTIYGHALSPGHHNRGAGALCKQRGTGAQADDFS